MQNLFATQNQTPIYTNPTPSPQPQTQYSNIATISGMPQSNLPKNNTNLNAMPNLFSTVSYTSPTTLNNQTFATDNQMHFLNPQ
jgi:hypothetical protein